MNNSDTTEAIPLWYKQPWLWFILTPLIAVFIYGFFFLYLSIATADGIVKDDYYKVARGIHLDPSREIAAKELEIKGKLNLDSVTGDVVLQLSGTFTKPPAQLSLDLIHPTHQKYDQSITLRNVPNSNNYIGNLSSAVSGKRYLTLFSEEGDWRIRKELVPPYDAQAIELSAQ